MPTLSTYLLQVQRLLNTGSSNNLYPQAELTDYINRARKQVAMASQSVRALTPVNGPVTSITVGSGGGGYSTAQVVVSAPDSPSGRAGFPNGAQATATAITGAGGRIASITILSGGAGYFSPGATISGAGSGATLTALLSGVNQTYRGQEVYSYASILPMIQAQQSGIGAVHSVGGISLIWGTFRYTLNHLGFGMYQAYVRNYAQGGFQRQPATFAQFSQGISGDVYLYPIPDQSYPMEWDVCCLPIDLASDADYDALPAPFTEAVCFYAAYYATLGKGRVSDAKNLWDQAQIFEKRARQATNPRGVKSYYGRI